MTSITVPDGVEVLARRTVPFSRRMRSLSWRGSSASSARRERRSSRDGRSARPSWTPAQSPGSSTPPAASVTATGACRRRRRASDRRVEITGPVERKMMINALNSGARVFMADFEDASSPTWTNVVEGQRNVRDAVRREIALDTGEKRTG